VVLGGLPGARALVAVVVAVVGLGAVGACGGGDYGPGADDVGATEPARPSTSPAPAPAGDGTTGSAAETVPPTTEAAAAEPPDWLGTRVLTTVPGESPPPTPAELDPRDLVTVDRLPPPPDGRFHASVRPVPPDVAARSTWHAGCPVTLDDLRYVTVSFWGFDDRAHTGELLVHRTAADAVAGVFRVMFDTRFPLEDMHVTTPAELDAPDTGDGNPTGGFVCRATRGSSSWSQHAYGLAVDVNPFHNPYWRNGRLLPGLASTYLDRAAPRPGMVAPSGEVAAAFGEMGWRWGGSWSQPDYMHFSSDGT
jgi:hypothetical protein